jgi:type I restriction enzyme, R subunit
MERSVKWLYAHDSYLKMPYQDNLAALIHEPTFKDTLAPGLFNQVRMIHKLGNMAVHSDTGINAQDGLQITKCLHTLLSWLVKAYTQGAPTAPAFDERLLPAVDAAAVVDRTAQQLQTLQDKYRDKDASFEAAQRKLADTQDEIDRLRAEIQRIKAENRQSIGGQQYSEAETRDLFIDLMLREAAWDPHGTNVHEYEVHGMPTAQGVGFVDYVLWGDDGLPLAVIEAKRTKVDSRSGQRQAELYADCLERMTGQRPVIYYTNGYETWIWDDTFYPPRAIQGFHTKDELQLMVNRRRTRKDITQAPINRNIIDRYYHEEAIRRIMECFGIDRSRAALVVMATGAGKTRLAIAAVEILMKCNWVRRVLFLADRTALLRQAKNACNKCYPQASVVNLVEEKENDDARIVFCSYPTMMNMIDDARADGQKRFGIGHFDLVIIDEAHRSVYQKFRAIFDYYDSPLLGLTATPKAEVDRNTYQLFELEDHVPTYAYELDHAVADEFLVPPRPVSVPLKFQRKGIKYNELSDEEKEEYEEKFYDEETGGWPDEIDAGALNQWLFNESTVDKVLAHLMEHGLKVAGGDRLGKTIIFAKNHHHAEFIAERFDKNYPHLAGKFCRVIDNHVKFAQSLIDDFYVADKPPFIAVSVDMLDTGIDVAEIVNLVFFKLVRSKTKFWQMVGRGTRLCPDLFGPGVDKEFFYVFDYCENLEFFGRQPEGYEAPVQESIKHKIFQRRVSLARQLQTGQQADEALRGLWSDLLDQLHGEVCRMNVNNFLVRPHRRYVEQFSDRQRWNDLSTGDAAEIEGHVAPLPTPDDDEEFARRFDLLLLNLQLAILERSPDQARYQQQVCDLAGGLEEKQTIPSVSQQMELILEVQTDAFWQNVTLAMLEQVRRRLRDLIKFIDREGGRQRVYTQFEDHVGEAQEVYGLIAKDPKLKNYHLKMQKFIRDHETHVTIQRLKNNRPITRADLESLESLVFGADGPGTREDYAATYGTDRPLGELVRSIVGLDQGAAKAAFADFLEKMPLSGDQIQFINMIIDHLVANGIMEPSRLFEPPFSDMHHEGVIGILPEYAEAIVATIAQINANAVAA